MTIYVDRFLPGFDWGKWKGGGHLLTTDLGELHDFAESIGLRLAWFQDKTFPHYDLTRSKRVLAIERGALTLPYLELPDDILVKTRNGTYESNGLRKQRHRKIL